MKKQTVVIFGPPGAGKGTQSELLSEMMGLYLFETSRILERKFREAANMPDDSKERFVEIEGEKFDVLEEKKIWGSGTLNSPPWVTYLVINEIKDLFKAGKNLVLSGSPRTVYEAERVMPVLEELYGKENVKIILLQIDPEQTFFRNSHRKICELIRHSILFTPETENLTLCPIDGSKLVKRGDLDTEESIKVRIEQYNQRTLPMVEYIEKSGFTVHKINGQQSPSDVYKDIQKALQ